MKRFLQKVVEAMRGPMAEKIAIELTGLASIALLVEGTRRIYAPAALILLGIILAIPYAYRTIAGGKDNQ
jgi:type IV secretory pathway VirB2 component (pilin)